MNKPMRWGIGLFILIIVGAAMWIWGYGAVLIAFLFGTIAGYAYRSMKGGQRACSSK